MGWYHSGEKENLNSCGDGMIEKRLSNLKNTHECQKNNKIFKHQMPNNALNLYNGQFLGRHQNHRENKTLTRVNNIILLQFGRPD